MPVDPRVVEKPGFKEATKAVANNALAVEMLGDNLAGLDGWILAVLRVAYPVVAGAVLAEIDQRLANLHTDTGLDLGVGRVCDHCEQPYSSSVDGATPGCLTLQIVRDLQREIRRG